MGELGWDGCSHWGNERGFMPLWWDSMGRVLGDRVGPVLMGVVPFLHPATFAVGQGACFQSPPTLCLFQMKRGISVLLQGVASYKGISVPSSPPLQPVGGMGYRGSEPF